MNFENIEKTYGFQLERIVNVVSTEIISKALRNYIFLVKK